MQYVEICAFDRVPDRLGTAGCLLWYAHCYRIRRAESGCRYSEYSSYERQGATGDKQCSASDGFGRRAVTIGSRSSVTYGFTRVRAKSGHAVVRARRSGGDWGFKAGTKIGWGFATARSVYLYQSRSTRIYYKRQEKYIIYDTTKEM